MFWNIDSDSRVQEPCQLIWAHLQFARIRQEKLKREGDGRSLVGRYSKLFSALFSDSDFPKERERERERGQNLPHALPGSYKLRYGCNVPVVYYIAGSKPGQCNGPPPPCPPAHIYNSPSHPHLPSHACPREMHPIPCRPLQGKNRRAIVACGSAPSLSFSLSLFVDAQDEELPEDRTETRIHGRAEEHRGACIARHAPVTRQKSLQQANESRPRASVVVPIRAISTFCAFVGRPREEEVQCTR